MSPRARSVLALVAGILSIIVVTTIVDIALHLVGVYGPMTEPLTDRLALLATAYRIPITVAGAWLTARLAPRDPMWHAMVLGGIGTGLAVAGLVATWNKGMGPHWYPIALVVMSLPLCWLGGWIHGRGASRG